MRAPVVLGLLALSSVAVAQPGGVCLKAQGNPVLVEVDRGKVEYCFDQGKSLSCYATDLLDGSLWVNSSSGAKRGADGTFPTTPAIATQPSAEAKEDSIEICLPNSTACKTFKPKDAIDPGIGLTVAVNPSGTLAALTNGSWIETFDLRSGKRLAHFKAGKGKQQCSFVDFAGDAIVVDHYDCGDMKISDTWIGTKLGKRLGVVGGKLPIGMATNPAQLDAKRWAFASRGGDAIAIHDLSNGKLLKRISIGPATEDVAPTLVYGLDSDDNEKVALVYDEARAGDIVIVELGTDKVQALPAKRCK